jgi:hypothetical protein
MDRDRPCPLRPRPTLDPSIDRICDQLAWVESRLQAMVAERRATPDASGAVVAFGAADGVADRAIQARIDSKLRWIESQLRAMVAASQGAYVPRPSDSDTTEKRLTVHSYPNHGWWLHAP